MTRPTIFISSLLALAVLTACDRQPVSPAPGDNSAAAPGAATQPAAPAGTPASATSSATVVGWGPRKTVQGQAVNAQKNGESALWIKMSGVELVKHNMTVSFDGKLVRHIFVNPSQNIVTMTIPAEYISTPGMKAVGIKPDPNAPEILVGDFEVTPAP